ncbi:cryptochrome-1-like isoform X2 [Phlebotomus argentipes]|uniref:cryptochrome-1-like isoform X2 n=1 Tax=Phlebotomus argentipes TaxID=94469 RepID=UPI00289308AE|nr:cryptochrome-1-like isoform X2 [Phlebotomus argentipes]
MPGDNSGNSSGAPTTNTSARQQSIREKHTVHWFRKGLRLHDNPALLSGLVGAVTFRCVFVIDPWFAGSSNVGINKWRFLLQCLEDLDRSLRKLNSRLFVIRGQPADALPKLFKDWGTTCLTFEEDPEPFGRVRDKNISEMCKELSIEVIQKVSHTLYKLENFCSIIEKNSSRAPLTYHQFQAIIATVDPPAPAEPSVTQDTIGKAYTPVSEDHDDKYGVPTLEELGFDVDILKPPVWVGGETEALARLERHLERKAWVASFGRPKMTPQSLLASQTGLSPYLRFGCLSTRLFYHQLTDLYKNIKRAYPPLSLHGQLLWREFFYCAATKNPNFDKMSGNPICVQIPWDKNAEALAKWANGQTGFPWIDAIMTQLREEGWIHHLARHAVACFLTRGDLWISWEEGMKVFEELLLDADWSVNAGMWMWLSCSSFFQQFFHCYCPVRFGRKADPNGDYIRRYLPVLKNFPTKYIHEPWNAPESVQRAAKCIIGKEYPLPMVNHAVASRTNMERMKQVYQQLAKYRGTSGIDETKIVGIIKAQNASDEVCSGLVQSMEGSYLARSKHIQVGQQHPLQEAYPAQFAMQMMPQHEAQQQNLYDKVPMEDMETYVNQDECSSRQPNPQYTRIILHRNIAYGVNDPMKPPSNEVLSYSNDQNHEFQQISRFPENFQNLSYEEAMAQKMKQEDGDRHGFEMPHPFRMESKNEDIFLVAAPQDMEDTPNICDDSGDK